MPGSRLSAITLIQLFRKVQRDEAEVKEAARARAATRAAAPLTPLPAPFFSCDIRTFCVGQNNARVWISPTPAGHGGVIWTRHECSKSLLEVKSPPQGTLRHDLMYCTKT